MLGVAAIAAVGLVRAAIERGLQDQGAVLLGGDAQMEFTYRFALPEERAWMDARAERVSEIVDFRSMAVIGEGEAAERALTQVKGVDGLYPLTGAVVLDPPVPLADALAGADGMPGAVMDKVLVDRLGLSVGDTFRLGTQTFRLGAVLLREPDSTAGGFALGPRTIVTTAGLAGSGLLEPGTLFETEYRLDLPDGADLEAMKLQAEAAFEDKGMSWSDSRRAAPGVERFVDRIGSFLVLVGLAGLAVGGVGVSAAVRAYLEGKVPTIATLKTVGAEGRVDLSRLPDADRGADGPGRGVGRAPGRGRAPAVLGRDRGAAALSGRIRAVSRTAGRGGLLRRDDGASVHALAVGADRTGAGGGALSRRIAGRRGGRAGPMWRHCWWSRRC